MEVEAARVSHASVHKFIAPESLEENSREILVVSTQRPVTIESFFTDMGELLFACKV